MLEHLHDDSAFNEAAARLRIWCGKNPTAMEHGECTADAEFMELLKSPKHYLHTRIELALTNLHNAENAIKRGSDSATHYSKPVKAAFSLYRAAAFRYRKGIAGWGVEINPSTARFEYRPASRLFLSALGASCQTT